MARAAENDDNINSERKPMRRSQSQRSLHRLSSDRKVMTMTPSEQPPPTSPPPSPSPSVSSPAILHKEEEDKKVQVEEEVVV
ncbi:hypothetical protein DFQ28_000896, partial [Apophysomyces sp. BC1034]